MKVENKACALIGALSIGLANSAHALDKVPIEIEQNTGLGCKHGGTRANVRTTTGGRALEATCTQASDIFLIGWDPLTGTINARSIAVGGMPLATARYPEIEEEKTIFFADESVYEYDSDLDSYRILAELPPPPSVVRERFQPWNAISGPLFAYSRWPQYPTPVPQVPPPPPTYPHPIVIDWEDTSTANKNGTFGDKTVQTDPESSSHPSISGKFIAYRASINFPTENEVMVRVFDTDPPGGASPGDIFASSFGDAFGYDYHNFVPHIAGDFLVWAVNDRQSNGLFFSQYIANIGFTTEVAVPSLPQCAAYLLPRVGGTTIPYILWSGFECIDEASGRSIERMLFLTVGNPRFGPTNVTTYMITTDFAFGLDYWDWFNVPYDIDEDLIVYEGISDAILVDIDESAL